MTEDQIKDYRDRVEDQLKEKANSIEATLSLVTIGALGLFLTINEKFLHLAVAQYKAIMILSFLLLVIAFILILVIQIVTSKFDERTLDFIDEMAPNDPAADNTLYDKWKLSSKRIKAITLGVYISLTLGIIFQLIFLGLNLKTKDTLDETKKNNNTNIYFNMDSVAFRNIKFRKEKIVTDSSTNTTLWLDKKE